MTEKNRSKNRILHLYNFFSYYFSGFCLNVSGYCFWLVLPILMRDLGASPFEIGLAGTVGFGIQGFIAPLCGKLADIVPPETLSVFGVQLHCLTCLIIGLSYITVTSTIPIYFILLIEAVALGLFASPTETLVGNEAHPGHESKNIAHYCMSWSAGKAIGFLSAGSLKSTIGSTYSLYVSCAIGFIPFFVMSRFPQRNNVKEEFKYTKIELEEMKDVQKDNLITNTKIESPNENKLESQPTIVPQEMETQTAIIMDNQNASSEENGSIEDNPELFKNNSSQPKRPTHYFLYYINDTILHVFIVGVVGIISNQYINMAKDRNIHLEGLSDDPNVFVGMILFLLNTGQFFAFLILSLFVSWQYKITLNIIALVSCLICLLVFLFCENGYVLCAFAAIIGFIAGFDFEENMFYSLNASEKEKGKFMGISECSSCLAYSLSPLVAGIISTLITSDWCIYTSIIWMGLGIVGCVSTEIYIKMVERKERNGHK